MRGEALVLALLLAAPLAGIGNGPEPAGRLLLPGRLVFGLTGLPTGELLAPCEDQSLSVLDDHARVLASWQASARFQGPVSVAPPGPLQLLAVPLLSGRVEVLAWDARTLALAPQFAFEHGAPPSTAATWDASGRVYQGWKDGRLEARSSRGQALWATTLDATPRYLLNDDTQGVFVAVTDGLRLLDRAGAELRRWSVPGTPRGLLQTLAGNLYLWSEAGLWLLDASQESFKKIDDSPDILGVATDRLNKLVVTETHRWRRLGPGGSGLVTAALPVAAEGPGVVDDRGRVYVPTGRGLEAWSYDGQWLATWGRAPPSSSPLVTAEGLLAWGTDDWFVEVWSGASLPPFAWSQDGGGPRRAWSTARPAPLVARVENWADEPQFGYFLELASSGDDAKQQTVLRLFEAKAAQGRLLADWPFANVILVKLLRSGLTDLELSANYITNNWPANRLRAYQLLSRTVTPEDREELLSILDREFDAVDLAQGARVLGALGWDGDGRLMQMLATLQARRPREAVLGDALADAARELWTATEASSEALVRLLTALYQGDYPRAVRLKAQKMFQDLMDRP